VRDNAYDAPKAGALRPPNQPAARPRAAATLILHRIRDSQIEVLMGQRHANLAFMPNLWVFPGGRLERSDYYKSSRHRLTARVEALVAGTVTEAKKEDQRRNMARALAACAVRETEEEVGLHLADEDGHARFDTLRFIASAITPPYRPRRFNARFFTAPADALQSLTPKISEGELNATAWFSLEAAQALDLPSVTRFVLSELNRHLADPDRAPVRLSYPRGGRKAAIPVDDR
jgi:8-oxo-dGTP pyrophosphatase MutT (NUDIX family)